MQKGDGVSSYDGFMVIAARPLIMKTRRESISKKKFVD